MAHRTGLAYYGNVRIKRGYCRSCGGYAFILSGQMACCGEPVDTAPSSAKRMSDVPVGRDVPKKKRMLEILHEQDYRCLYCLRPFGSFVYRGRKPIKLRLHWDHMTPYCYSMNNRPDNFAAACHICNGIKSSFVFNTVEEARIAISARWEEKGFTQENL